VKSGSQIFELFGYPVDSWNEAAAANMRRCQCPFMGCECDGGGNRYASGIDLRKNKKLRRYFPGKKVIQSGVCSLQLKPGEQPWIVCPRRLLNYRQCDQSAHKSIVRDRLHDLAGLTAGSSFSVWSEVKMKCPLERNGRQLFFDYTFDYVIAASMRISLSRVSEMFGWTQDDVRTALEENGFTTAYRERQWFCDDFPTAPLVIVEVMTSSTSGGNKAKRTQVAQLFEDTVYRLANENVDAAGPGINYRQVWARMVSQLLVKSQIAIEWGGTAFWVLQDLLADYISKTTALDLNDFLSNHRSEVNIVAGGYGNNVSPLNREGSFAEIDDVKLFSGPVSASPATAKSFSDIIKLGAVPDVSDLWKHLVSKRPCANLKI